MKVCTHMGLDIAVLTRNEHCPPHVHVGTDKWDARFQFSFWHNGVRLWDVTPAQNAPNATVLEDLRQVLKLPKHLRRRANCGGAAGSRFAWITSNGMWYRKK